MTSGYWSAKVLQTSYQQQREGEDTEFRGHQKNPKKTQTSGEQNNAPPLLHPKQGTCKSVPVKRGYSHLHQKTAGKILILH